MKSISGNSPRLHRPAADVISAPSKDVGVKLTGTTLTLQDDSRLEMTSKAAKAVGTVITADFSTSPIGADAAAQLFASELQRGDPTDLVGLTQYLSALGVQVGYEGTPLSHFAGLTHRLPNVSFPSDPAAHLLPAMMAVQELSARTKQMAVSLSGDASPQNLRSCKTEAVFIAHQLAEIWTRAPSLDSGSDLQAPALQALKNVAELQGRIQFAMQDFVENTKRSMGLATEGPQPIIDSANGALVFRNSLRLGRVELDPALRQQELDAKYQKALTKGVKASDVEDMSPGFLDKTPHGARFEYVLVPHYKGADDKLRVTLNEAAGHSMLAGVDPATVGTIADDKRQLEDNTSRVAGGARLLRADDGTQIVLVDPKSGHYRAPTQQADQLVPFLVAAGVPRDNIIVTSGDPLDTGEVLAIDVWVFKAANNNTLPKETGDKFRDDSVALQKQAVANGKQVADGLFGTGS
jgi:hypothetical protein